jgi:hypothetical protein
MYHDVPPLSISKYIENMAPFSVDFPYFVRNYLLPHGRKSALPDFFFTLFLHAMFLLPLSTEHEQKKSPMFHSVFHTNLPFFCGYP